MSRRSRRKPLVPGAESGLDALKAHVMKLEGYPVDRERPDSVKYEVARSRGIPLVQGNNGSLSTQAAGKVGGPIGGAMVRELVRMAKEQLERQR
ncbi:alpha/beta-type small acid-soluble spore protein [Gorillibacterium timonense]|uniref:alpha/beta-type small acid-soluble spore protein n=1 Tax=Gorillibacterium timonense TaxID=1689269 RepID=UPI00071D1313|nr:alpha/beta-type small acid-soluble spore protein [Gorillibacterium timonense]